MKTVRAVAAAALLVVISAGCGAPPGATSTPSRTASAAVTAAPSLAPAATHTPPPTLDLPPQSGVLPSDFNGQIPEGAAAVLGLGHLQASVAPDGLTLAVGSSAGTQFIDLKTLQTRWQSPFTGAAWQPDGATVRVGREIRDIAVGELIGPADLATEWSVTSRDGRIVAARGPEPYIILLKDASTGAVLHQLPPPDGTTVERHRVKTRAYAWFSPHTRLVATTYQWRDADMIETGEAVSIWSIATGELVQTIKATANEASWSPDGAALMTIDYRGMSLWEVPAWTRVADYTPNNEWILWTPDGSTFVIDQGLYETATGKQRYEFPSTRAALSPNGKLAALQQRLTTSSRVTILDTQTMTAESVIDGAETPVGFSSDGSRLVTFAQYSEILTVWDLRSGGASDAALTLRGTGAVNDVTWSPDGATIASGIGYIGDFPAIGLWDVSRAHSTALRHLGDRYVYDNQVVSLDWQPGRPGILLSTAGGNTRYFDPTTQALWDAQLPGAPRKILSPDGTRVAAIGARSGDLPLRIGVWDTATGDLIRSLELGPDPVSAFGWSPDGHTLAITTIEGGSIYWDTEPADTGTLTLWNVDSGETSARPIGVEDIPYSVAWSPGGDQIAIGFKVSAAIWSMADGKTTQVMKNPAEVVPELVYVDIAWSPGGETIAAAYGRNPNIRECNGCPFYLAGHAARWDARTGSLVQLFDAHTAEVEAVAFSPDGRSLATASWDGTIIVWNIPD